MSVVYLITVAYILVLTTLVGLKALEPLIGIYFLLAMVAVVIVGFSFFGVKKRGS